MLQFDDKVAKLYRVIQECSLSERHARVDEFKKDALICDETLTQTLLKLDLIECSGELRQRRKTIIRRINALHKIIDAARALLP